MLNVDSDIRVGNGLPRIAFDEIEVELNRFSRYRRRSLIRPDVNNLIAHYFLKPLAAKAIGESGSHDYKSNKNRNNAFHL